MGDGIGLVGCRGLGLRVQGLQDLGLKLVDLREGSSEQFEPSPKQQWKPIQSKRLFVRGRTLAGCS